jgi:hypothetical protein
MSRQTVTLAMRVVKRCPYAGETDRGDLVIVFASGGEDVPELHNLAKAIGELTAEPVSHEAFTAGVAELVPGAGVMSTWQTGPWRVEVRDGDQVLLAAR